MRHLWFFLLLLAGQTPDWVEFRVVPADARISLQRSGYAPAALGQAGQRLPRAGQSGPVTLVIQRDGWSDRTLSLAELPAGVYPPSEQPPLHLEPAPGGGGARAVYYTARALPYAFVALLLGSVGLALRPKKRSAGEAYRDPADPLLGSTLGGHILAERLGEGGMATVYRGLPDVAVKVLHRENASDPSYRKRFEHEIRMCRELNHPNLVRVLGSGHEQGSLYFTLELLRGKTLREVGPLEPGRALELVAQAMEGVAHAHARGIVHRDLKPENLFLTEQGTLKVVDFGVARAENYTALTATGVVFGTPTYLAPEQIDGEAVPASDQYALGIVLFELLTGSPPFDHPDPLALAQLHLSKLAPPVRSLRPELTPEVETLVARLLKKSPKTRFPDMAQAAAAVRAAL